MDLVTWLALPTSVWMSTYALTVIFDRLPVCRTSGPPNGTEVRRDTRRAFLLVSRASATLPRTMPKVTVIGAGSVEFTRNILADLCAFDDLHGSLAISLHDIDPERLRYAERAARQVVERT